MKKRTDEYEEAMTDSDKVRKEMEKRDKHLLIFLINCTRFNTNKPPFNTNDHSDEG